MNDLNELRFECENEIKPQGDVTSPLILGYLDACGP